MYKQFIYNIYYVIIPETSGRIVLGFIPSKQNGTVFGYDIYDVMKMIVLVYVLINY